MSAIFEEGYPHEEVGGRENSLRSLGGGGGGGVGLLKKEGKILEIIIPHPRLDYQPLFGE